MSYVPGKDISLYVRVEQPRVHDMRKTIVVSVEARSTPTRVVACRAIEESDFVADEESAVRAAIGDAVSEVLGMADLAHEFECQCGIRYTETPRGIKRIENRRAFVHTPKMGDT